MLITVLKEAHVPMVAALEKECFTEPWSEQALTSLLSPSSIALVACADTGEVMAYGAMLTVLDEGQITNIAVSCAYRRQGVGRALLGALLEEAKRRGIATVSLEVRASNQGAQALYREKGFEFCGIRKGFYTHPREDGVVMVATL